MNTRIGDAGFALALAILLAAPTPASAEAPGHNPNLDHKCSEGFQWSRKTVTCVQANCPPGPGAGRVYTLGCNCGEAWGKPFRTCFDERRLATHCISNKAQCANVPGGFDPVSGDCKMMQGYVWNEDKSGCVRELPAEMKCTLQRLNGDPVGGGAVTAVQAKTDKAPRWTAQLTTAADGTFSFKPGDRRAEQTKLIFRGGGDQYRIIHEINTNTWDGKCVLTVLTVADVEAEVKDEYADFLADACLPPATVAKIRAVQFGIEEGLSNSQYMQAEKAVQMAETDLMSGWSGLRRSVFHEFGHAVSDTIIDPSGAFVKGVPLYGKYVGGSHDNWIVGKDTMMIDAKENAFEEALADFMAMLYFHSKGELYQADLADSKVALGHLGKLGANDKERLEGGISSFLWELYRPQIESGPGGAAKALGDFVRSVQCNDRHDWGGTPARTMRAFVAAKAKCDKLDTPDACTRDPAAKPKLADLARKYGFDGRKGQVSVSLAPSEGTDPAAAAAALSGAGQWQGGDISSIHSMIPVPGHNIDIPEGLGVTEVSVQRPGYAAGDRSGRVVFGPEQPTSFTVLPTEMIQIDVGSARVFDTEVRLPGVQIKHLETEYVVDVRDGEAKVAVVSGRVELRETAGQGRSYTIEANKGARYTAEAGFEEADGREIIYDFEDAFPKAAVARADGGGQSAGSGDGTGSDGVMLMIGGAFAALLALWFGARWLRRRRE